jgi:hypothetical protein
VLGTWTCEKDRLLLVPGDRNLGTLLTVTPRIAIVTIAGSGLTLAVSTVVAASAICKGIGEGIHESASAFIR